MTHQHTAAASSQPAAMRTLDVPSVDSVEPVASEAFLTLLAHMAEAALLLDADGRVLYCNARLPELLGCGALQGRAFSDCMLPYDLSEWTQRLANALVATTRYELNFRAGDGTVVPLLLLTTPTNHQGMPAIAVVVTPPSPLKAAVLLPGPRTDLGNIDASYCRDNLDPILCVQELWQLNQRYKTALIHAHVSMFEQDVDLRYLWIFNPTFVQGSDAIIGKTSAEFFDESCATQLDQFRRQVIVSGEPMRREVTLKDKAGRHTRYFEMHLEPLRDACGQINGVRSVVIDIEERKQFELRLLNIFSNSPTAIAISRLSDAVFIDVNAAFLAIHGYDRDEIIGHTSTELNLWNNSEARANRMQELLDSKIITNFTSEYRHKSGRIGHVLGTIGLIKISGEDHVIGFLNDITEMSHVHEEVRQSEARFRLLASATFEGIAIIKDGIVLEINEQMSHILGYPAHEVIGQTVQRFIAPDYIDRARAQLASGGESISEYDFIQKNGSRIKVEVRSRDFLRGDELLQLSAIRDVTERYLSLESLRQAQARLQSLMDSNIVGVEISSLDGQIFEANDYKLKLLRRTRQDLEAGLIRWTDYSSANKSEAEQGRSQVRQYGKCMPFEREYHFDDGTTVPVMIALSLLPGPDEKVIAITLDISPIKRIEGELARANAKLLQRTIEAESAAVAKTRFLSTVSHELRTPLHTILGYVRLLRKEAIGEIQSQLNIVQQSSTRLLQLIDDLLDFNLNTSQNDALQLEWMEIDTFLSEVEHQGGISAKSGNNSFVISTKGDIPASVLADEKRLLQIVRNLVSNACKYTRDGNVTVLLKREPALKAGYSESTCRIQFSVTDTGRGIAPQDLHRIFEPFLRGHGAEDQPGVGLGLAVASQWVRNMGGELTVQSKLDAGSCFRFTLDLICSEDRLLLQKTVSLMSLEGCKTYMPTLAANHPRVLLVDDNEANRVFLSALCENLGYAVVHASSGDEALLLCQFAKQPFIAALIDQVMPQMDGWELLKRLRQMEGFGATASVLISASPPCRPTDFPASVNFDLMLTKPFEESILMCFLCHELADVPRNAQNCWHLQKGPIQPVRTILPEYELQTFAELLDMGRLMRITEWARKLSAQNEYAQVSTQIIQLAESADLPGLRDLLTQLRHSSTQIHSDNQGK